MAPRVLVVVVVLLLWSPPAAADVRWIDPIDAPVVDPFRPPENRFSAGNRGLEYGPDREQPIWAVAPGRVVFAGQVGGDLFVTVEHEGNLRSTYAYLAEIEVVRGQKVDQRQRLGTAGEGFHLTARLGDEYVDPAQLIAGAQPAARLTSGVARPERSAVLASDRQSLAAAGVAATELLPVDLVVDAAQAVSDWYHQDCTPDGAVVEQPPGERVLVTVGGLGSNSGGASIGSLDGEALGYSSEDTVSFSYNGGCTPTPFGSDGPPGGLSTELASSSYGAEDTFVSLDQSAERLADLLVEVAAARPGQPIDVAAHSLGGVVTRLAVDKLEERGQLGPIDVVLTVGSPHDGAPLGNAAFGSADGMIGEWADGYLPHGGDERLAVSTAELSGVDGIAAEMTTAPAGVKAVAVAAAGDLIVPAERARWDGATNVLVPQRGTSLADTHTVIPGRPEVARALELARAGAPPSCLGLIELLTSTGLGAGIDAAESALGVVVGLDGWIW